MFKRNQVEEAIASVFQAGSAKPGSETRTRLKRLLEIDRGLGRNKRAADPERANFAFFSTDAPGRGVEIWFSEYEAFALLVGLGLMQHGWPQGFAVEVLRRVRPELERHHARILRQDPAELFDEQRIRARETRRYCGVQHRPRVPRHYFERSRRPSGINHSCDMSGPGGYDALRSGTRSEGMDHVRTREFRPRPLFRACQD